jgi:hypothetical protein
MLSDAGFTYPSSLMSVVGLFAVAVLFLVATDSAGLAASAQCNAELRKCSSRCNRVYESARANRVCHDRCKDKFYVCKASGN